jgi:pimeloyl-ACP methyl ester carboxylesterase
VLHVCLERRSQFRDFEPCGIADCHSDGHLVPEANLCPAVFSAFCSDRLSRRNGSAAQSRLFDKARGNGAAVFLWCCLGRYHRAAITSNALENAAQDAGREQFQANVVRPRACLRGRRRNAGLASAHSAYTSGRASGSGLIVDAVIFIAVLLSFTAAAITYQALGSRRDFRRFPAPGRLINIGPCRLHLHDQGAGSPVVVLESGIAASSLSWALVQPEVAQFTRVCSYDRAGLSWSDSCAGPRTLHRIVYELTSLLSHAGISGPYVLVGHSFGGTVIRAFAHLQSSDVAGLIFLDPVSLEYWANCGPKEEGRLRLAAKLSRRGALLARIGLVRAALTALASGHKRISKLIARISAGQSTTVISRLLGEIQRLPRELWPILRAHWSRPKCFRAMAEYLECLPESARIARMMPIPAEVPFIILSASNATEAELEERDSWVRESVRGRHIRMEQGGHWLQLEQPDIVVELIREVVGLAKNKSGYQRPDHHGPSLGGVLKAVTSSGRGASIFYMLGLTCRRTRHAASQI